MEAAHSQHVSLLSQRSKLAHILSAIRINHYLPLYKPAAERSTLCTVRVSSELKSNSLKEGTISFVNNLKTTQ